MIAASSQQTSSLNFLPTGDAQATALGQQRSCATLPKFSNNSQNLGPYGLRAVKSTPYNC